MKLQSSKVRYWRYSVFPHLNIELDHLPSPSPVRLPPHISSPLPYSLLSSFRGFSCFNCGDSMFITRRLSTSICVLDSGTKTAIFFLNSFIVLGTNFSSKTVFVKHNLSGTELRGTIPSEHCDRLLAKRSRATDTVLAVDNY